MSTKSKILWIGSSGQTTIQQTLQNNIDIEFVPTPLEAISRLARNQYGGVYLDGQRVDSGEGIVRLLQSERILDGMPDGVALVNADMVVTWANGRLRSWSPLPEVLGQNFYATLGNTQIMGPDFCPFHTALATGSPSSSTLQSEDNRYYQVHVAPLTDAATDQAALVATVSDITAEIYQQHKLAAIHQAGQRLTDLKPDEIFAMDTSFRRCRRGGVREVSLVFLSCSNRRE